PVPYDRDARGADDLHRAIRLQRPRGGAEPARRPRRRRPVDPVLGSDRRPVRRPGRGPLPGVRVFNRPPGDAPRKLSERSGLHLARRLGDREPHLRSESRRSVLPRGRHRHRRRTRTVGALWKLSRRPAVLSAAPPAGSISGTPSAASTAAPTAATCSPTTPCRPITSPAPTATATSR